ncbi:MAG: DUF3494 domain-containing protein [Acidobacteria bacterium]|nr:DUF3494 domain-containing protein [Acidobacteriota bacterium]
MASTVQGYADATTRRRRPLAVGAGLGLLVAGALVAVGASPALAAGVPGSPGYLGAAESFAVLGGSTVTNTGAPTHVWGDVGVWPGSALIGFQPNQVGGTQHAADSAAQNAQTSLTDAYGAAAAASPSDSVDHAVISNTTFLPGVYKAASSMDFTGTVTLDGRGDANATWVFQAGTTLTSGSGSRVVVINGNPCNVYWQVGSSATLGSSTTFVGTVLADTSITAVTSATVDGRLLARSGGVTLDSNQITAPACSLTDSSGVTIPASTSTPTPTPTATTGGGTPTPGPSASPSPTSGKPTPTASRGPRPTASPAPSGASGVGGGTTGSGTGTGTGTLATTGSAIVQPLSLAAALMLAGGLVLAVPVLRRRRATARG